MGRRRSAAAALVAVAGAALLSSSASAAIINASGLIHCSAQATVLVQVNDNPPDVTFAPPATGGSNHANASTSATIMGLGFQSCGASVTATVSTLSGVHVDVAQNLQTSGVGIPLAPANGNVSFTETSTELVTASLTHSGPGGAGTWDLKDSSSATVLSGAGSITLTPGTYTLVWSPAPGFSGNGSPTTSYALVPEPAGLVAIALITLPLMRPDRRRRNRCPKHGPGLDMIMVPGGGRRGEQLARRRT